MGTVSPDHPRLPLLFALEGDPSDEHAAALRAVVRELVGLRAWSVGVPRFVDEVDDSSCTLPEDVPIRTVGVFVEVYSGFPPWGDRLPAAVDRSQYEDVRVLVERLAQFSREIDDDIVVEFEGEAIGWIEDGKPDRGLAVGLLGEWRRTVEEREMSESAP